MTTSGFVLLFWGVFLGGRGEAGKLGLFVCLSIYLSILMVLLRIEPRISCITTELYPPPRMTPRV